MFLVNLQFNIDVEAKLFAPVLILFHFVISVKIKVTLMQADHNMVDCLIHSGLYNESDVGN